MVTARRWNQGRRPGKATAASSCRPHGRYFHLYLAEVCYRFNHHGQDLESQLFGTF